MRGQRLGAASSVLSQVDTALASGLLPSSLHHTLLNPVLVQVYMFTIYAKSKFTKPKYSLVLWPPSVLETHLDLFDPLKPTHRLTNGPLVHTEL